MGNTIQISELERAIFDYIAEAYGCPALEAWRTGGALVVAGYSLSDEYHLLVVHADMPGLGLRHWIEVAAKQAAAWEAVLRDEMASTGYDADTIRDILNGYPVLCALAYHADWLADEPLQSIAWPERFIESPVIAIMRAGDKWSFDELTMPDPQ